MTVCFGHPQDSTFTQRSYSLVQEYTSASLILLSECPPLSLHSWHRRIDSCCPQHCCVHGTEETECPPTRPHPSVGRETGRKLLSERSSEVSVCHLGDSTSVSHCDVPASCFLGTVVSSASQARNFKPPCFFIPCNHSVSSFQIPQRCLSFYFLFPQPPYIFAPSSAARNSV